MTRRPRGSRRVRRGASPARRPWNRRAVARARRRKAALLLLGVVAPVLLFLAIAEGIGVRELAALDERALAFVETLHADRLTTGMRILTFFGASWGAGLLTTILIVVLLLQRRRRDAVFTFVVMAGGGVLQYLAKLVFERPRPSVFPPLADAVTYSYPSGHAMMSSCLAMVLAIVCWETRWRWPAILVGVAYALGVALTRLYLGVHYPSDLVAGWCLAVAWTSLLWLVFDLAGRRVPSPGG